MVRLCVCWQKWRNCHPSYVICVSPAAEPTIRMLILDTVAVLLEHHSRLCLTSDLENGMENKERLFDVPIRMVSDINQQVCLNLSSLVLLVSPSLPSFIISSYFSFAISFLTRFVFSSFPSFSILFFLLLFCFSLASFFRHPTLDK